MNDNNRDATKLNLPIITVGSVIAVAIAAGWWLNGLVTGIAKDIGSIERRLAAVEVNINAFANVQNSLTFDGRVLQERQSALNERLNDMQARMLRLEDWQRAVNARPNP